MKALDIVIADPIVLAIHVVGFALRQPHVSPVLFFFELTNLVVAEEARCFGEIAVRGILVTTGRQAVLTLVFQIETTSVGWQAEHDLMRWTSILDPFNCFFIFVVEFRTKKY